MTEHELFKEAVMQNMVDDARVQRESKTRKHHPVARKVAFAAACLLVAVSVTVFAIPSARAAVEEWINGIFSPNGYFGQEQNARTEEPTIEAITTLAGESTLTLSNVGEEFQAYANTFDMKLDEIAYDGESIFVSGTMSGATARPFVEAQTGGDTFRAAKYDGSLGGDPDWEYYFFACENWMKFVSSDGQTFMGELVPFFTPEMDAICIALSAETPEKVFKDGALVTSNKKADALWDSYLADHDIRFSATLEHTGQDTGPLSAQDAEPLSGQVSGELSLRMRYDNVDGADSVEVLTASFGSIALDADAYRALTKTTEAKTETKVDLGGVHPVSITEWQAEEEQTSDDCEIYYSTHELDFSGASFSLKEITFTPTDTQITLHVVLPESWTAAERFNSGPIFHFFLDGEVAQDEDHSLFSYSGQTGTCDPTGKTREYDCSFFESNLSPSAWGKVKTLTIVPVTGYWWEMKVSHDNGPSASFSLQNDAVVTTYVNRTSVEYSILYDKMTQYALTINLDDYR
ncbi:MAG TPA: hypothetical protein PKA81_08205 [Clostridia bacterium]|nr:hypothetical protein [Clostridia bacterium]